jgi:hypothetical protein
MTLLGRLFGTKAPPPPPNSVVIDSELVSELTAGGEPLDRAVDAALRAHLAALHAPQPEAPPPPERVPFWLQRGHEGDAIEDALRDRIIHRRETESDSRT